MEEDSTSLLMGGGFPREMSSCDCRTWSGGDGLGEEEQCGQRLVAIFGELNGENIEKGLGKEGLRGQEEQLGLWSGALGSHERFQSGGEAHNHL